MSEPSIGTVLKESASRLAQSPETWAVLRSVALAAMGGLVREISSKGQHKFIHFVAGALIGAFAGVMAMYFCRFLNVGDSLTAATAGMAGYMGTPFLDWLSKRMLSKIVSKDEETKL